MLPKNDVITHIGATRHLFKKRSSNDLIKDSVQRVTRGGKPEWLWLSLKAV